MAPSLEENEHVVVSKVAYGLWLPGFAKQLVRWATPERGEVVVFTRDDDPKTIGDESERTMVKRVVAVGGDSVVIKGTTVSVNGVSLWEPYAHWSRGGSTEAQVFAVPYGTVFVLGDNRDESFDSRYWRDPFVEQSRIVGPVALVY
jgi:signal peptidase I